MYVGWTNQKPQEEEEAQITASMADSTILTSFVDSQNHSQNHIPKLEDFLGDFRYSDNSQTETQDSSSLTHIYDPRHHQNQTGFYSDHSHDFKAMTGFQTAFSTNSGSEVDDSVSMSRTHLAGEYLGHVVESSGQELGFIHGGANTGGALSLGVNTNNTNNQISEYNYRANNNGERIINNNNREKTDSEKEKPVVAVERSDSSNKKVADTFGQRTSIYRGVTRYVQNQEESKELPLVKAID